MYMKTRLRGLALECLFETVQFSSVLFSFYVRHSTKPELVPVHVHICILMHRPHCGCFYRVCQSHVDGYERDPFCGTG